MGKRVDFRTLQCATDLIALARTDPFPFDPAIRSLVETHDCRIDSTDDTLKALEPLEVAAADPGHAGFSAAHAILLADCLQGGLSVQSLVLNWATSGADLAALPLWPRSAILRGYQMVLRDAHNYDGPGVATVAAGSLDAILADLATIARQAREDEILHIARADYGYMAEEHEVALREIIPDPLGWGQRYDHWTPSEVIELISHVPAQTGFPTATALLMIKTLQEGDVRDDLCSRWQNNAAFYLGMSQQHRAAFTAGFRYLYETDEGWNPYWSAVFDPQDHAAVLIPPYETRYLRPEHT